MRTYSPIIGMKFGLGPNGPLFNGRPVGQQPAGIGQGETIHVDSRIPSGTGESPFAPVRSMREAMAQCEHDRGDCIVLSPYHREVLTRDGGFVHDKRGVSVVGTGNRGQLPTLIVEGGWSWRVTAPGGMIANLAIMAGNGDVHAAIDVVAPAVSVIGVEFMSAYEKRFEADIAIASTDDGQCDRLWVERCRGSAIDFLSVSADLDGLVILDNVVGGSLIKLAPGKRLTRLDIEGNRRIGEKVEAKAETLVISAEGTLLKPAPKPETKAA